MRESLKSIGAWIMICNELKPRVNQNGNRFKNKYKKTGMTMIAPIA